jgi:hypothetical protein
LLAQDGERGAAMSYGSYFALVLFLSSFAAVAMLLAFPNTPTQRFVSSLANRPEIDAAIQQRSLEQALNILTPVLLSISIGSALPDRIASFEQAYWGLVLIVWIIWWMWIQILLFRYFVDTRDINVLGTAIIYRPGYLIALIVFYFGWVTFLLTGDAIDWLGVVMLADLLWRIVLAAFTRASSRRAT